MSAPTTTTSSPPSPRPRRRIVGVSTKMYFSASQTSQYLTSLLSLLSSSPPSTLSLLRSRVDIFFIPDHLTLHSCITTLSSSSAPIPILPGAQDAHHADAGAYTGEVSPRVLAELGCRLLEINHAERRRLFGETDVSASLKVEAAARNGMTPLLCVGEVTPPSYLSPSSDSPDSASPSPTPAQVSAGAAAAADEIASQLATLLSRLDPAADAVLAYEPVWAIGAARPAGADHVVGVARRLRRLGCVARRTGATRIVYGGSAGPGLFAELARGGGRGDAVDGLFLGRFAHDPEQFYKTILEVAEA
ncbi:mitochondrial triosephosphate isomerase [Biscogniauxia mediterranea]|nr:mitochondrial triosephosphate isomerase [Biscogniauxia mediterranea]